MNGFSLDVYDFVRQFRIAVACIKGQQTEGALLVVSEERLGLLLYKEVLLVR